MNFQSWYKWFLLKKKKVFTILGSILTDKTNFFFLFMYSFGIELLKQTKFNTWNRMAFVDILKTAGKF